MIAINIEMPKACGECPIPCITDDMELQCPFQKLYVTGLGKRAEGCPLKELKDENKVEVITHGNCMICGKELTEGLFLCKECESKANGRK